MKNQGISENIALDYFWVDLYIGTLMRYGDESTGNWGAHKIWSRTLELYTSSSPLLLLLSLSHVKHEDFNRLHVASGAVLES